MVPHYIISRRVLDLDRLTERLKDKKPEKETPEPGKKDKIMGMHAEGDDITMARCESCGERFPGSELKEKDGLYYCSSCFSKLSAE